MAKFKRSQDFGRSLNNATITQTHQKKTNNIYHLFYGQNLYDPLDLGFQFSLLLSRLFEDPKI